MSFDEDNAAKSFLIEISKGNVPGHSLVSIIAMNPSVGLIPVDLWNANVPYVKPTANVALEILSSNVNDTLLGTGAQTVLIEYLSDDYETHFIIKEMNGATPVPVALDYFRMQALTVIKSGSSLFNEGTITARVGGDIQGQIPFTDRGLSIDQDGHRTIPLGSTGFAVDVSVFYPKGEDGFARSILSTDRGTEYSGATFPFYQSGLQMFFNAPFSLPEKTDISFQATTNNPSGAQITLAASILLIENKFITSEFLAPARLL